MIKIRNDDRAPLAFCMTVLINENTQFLLEFINHDDILSSESDYEFQAFYMSIFDHEEMQPGDTNKNGFAIPRREIQIVKEFLRTHSRLHETLVGLKRLYGIRNPELTDLLDSYQTLIKFTRKCSRTLRIENRKIPTQNPLNVPRQPFEQLYEEKTPDHVRIRNRELAPMLAAQDKFMAQIVDFMTAVGPEYEFFDRLNNLVKEIKRKDFLDGIEFRGGFRPKDPKETN